MINGDDGSSDLGDIDELNGPDERDWRWDSPLPGNLQDFSSLELGRSIKRYLAVDHTAFNVGILL